jgi:hypothetical protein
LHSDFDNVYELLKSMVMSQVTQKGTSSLAATIFYLMEI